MKNYIFIDDNKIEMTDERTEKLQASRGTWKDHISHGNCYRLGRSVDEKIKEILGGTYGR